MTNGAIVTPVIGPAGLTGTIVEKSGGAVSFTAFQSGNGVSFAKGGQQNKHTSFYLFSGSAIPGILSMNQGEIDFTLRSSYSFAERLALPPATDRILLDIIDGKTHLFTFDTVAASGRLVFYYQTGGTTQQTYYVPQGKEDSLFGKNVVASFRLTWTGTQNTLYINGVAVATTSYTQAVPNWSSPALAFGANTSAYSSLDDSVANFQVLGPAPTATQTTSPALHSIRHDRPEVPPYVPTRAMDNGRSAIIRVVNSASRHVEESCSPGALVTVDGHGFIDPDSRSLPRLLINNVDVPLVSASSTQIDFVCPAEASGTDLKLTIESGERISNSAHLKVGQSHLGIPSMDGSGSGQGVIRVAADNALAMTADPDLTAHSATPGDLVLIPVTGIDPSQPVSVRISGISVPGTIESSDAQGYHNVRAVVPSEIESGAIPVQVEQTVSDKKIESNVVTIAVASLLNQ